MRVELHCHSTCSDGSWAPEAVAEAAAGRDVRLFCLTDHDTMAGHPATAEVLGDGVVVLRGLELSCRVYARTLHLLMYGVREGEGRAQLQARLDAVGEARRTRITAICEALARQGVELDPAPILAGAVGRTPGRPDVARALVEEGVCTSPREAFDRFLGDGKKAHIEVDRITLEEGLSLGRACGARMSLAHPHTMGSVDVVKELFREHREQGLEGIEALYGRYARAEARPWLMLARELDLVVTGGSDFHGDMLPDVTRPVIDLDDAHARPLCEWLEVDVAA